MQGKEQGASPNKWDQGKARGGRRFHDVRSEHPDGQIRMILTGIYGARSDRDPVGHPGHSPRKRHHHNLNGVYGSFARTRVPGVVGIQVKHGKVEFGRSGCRKVRMGFGPLLCRRVKVKTARRAVRRIAFGPNAAFWALNFHDVKVLLNGKCVSSNCLSIFL